MLSAQQNERLTRAGPGTPAAHRRVDLRLGIPERTGLRCPHHGWLYDVDGQRLEMPAEDEASTFASRIRLKSYPAQELGGLIFACLGPQPAPLLPRWSIFVKENAYRIVGQTMLNANWLQRQENSVDTVHLEWDHGHWGLHALEEKGVADPRRWRRFRNAKRRHIAPVDDDRAWHLVYHVYDPGPDVRAPEQEHLAIAGKAGS